MVTVYVRCRLCNHRMFIAGLDVTPALREAQAVKGEANEHISEQESAQASYP